MSKNPIVNQTIDKMVKEKFLTIFKNARFDAEESFSKSIASQFSGMSDYEKVKCLNSEKAKAIALNDDVTLSAYVGSSTNEDWLLKLFSSRTAILNVDDTKDLQKAVYAGRLRQLISDELLEMRNTLPKYSFYDFTQGKEDKIFLELGYTWHLADSVDTDDIRFWQSDKIFNILSYETTLIIKKIQSELISNVNPIKIISNDVEIYNNKIKEKEFTSPISLIDSLKQLSFLEEYDFDLLNNIEALNDLRIFQELELSWNKITPNYVNRSRELLKISESKKPFSESPIIFYTIAQVIYWMEKVIKGKPLKDTFAFPNYEVVAENILKKAKKEADLIISKFEKSNNIYAISAQDAERHYIRELDKARYEFNNLEDCEKQYYASIHRENVINIFSINALFFDFEDHELALKKAANLYFRLTTYYHGCKNINESNHINFPNLDDGFNPSEINFLASTMVLDNDLHDKLTKTYNTGLSDAMQYSLYLELMLQNIKEQLHEIFIECIERLLVYLEDCEPGNKVLYIQSRLKELRQRELKLSSLSKQHNVRNDFAYTSLLKEYLEIEAEYITSTKDVHVISSFNAPKQQKALPTQTTFSFGYKQKDTTKLLSFIKALNLKIDLLNEQHTTPNDLMVVFSANELNDQLPKIYFNCETTQLYYIFNKLKTHFSKLTFKNIEESQLFYTKNGTLLKGQNLSASKVDNPKDYQEIDKEFSLLQ